MKCYACGYEKRDEQIETKEVTYFKAGSKKGQVKEVKTNYIELDKDKEDFLLIEPKITSNDSPPFTKREICDLFTRVSRDCAIFACPKCGTLKIEIGNEQD